MDSRVRDVNGGTGEHLENAVITSAVDHGCPHAVTDYDDVIGDIQVTRGCRIFARSGERESISTAPHEGYGIGATICIGIEDGLAQGPGAPIRRRRDGISGQYPFPCLLRGFVNNDSRFNRAGRNL